MGMKRVSPQIVMKGCLQICKIGSKKRKKRFSTLQQRLRGQGRKVYPGIKLTPNQETVVNRLLATNGICSKEQLYDALYLSREGPKPDPKILRETIRIVRKQLRSHGIEIKNEFGKGYTMLRESKASSES